MTQKEIGESIKAKRQAMNMTQADLAAATGLSQASITMYESGRRRPSSAAAEVLAAALGIPVWSITFSEGEVAHKTPAHTQPFPPLPNAIPYTPARAMVPIVGSVRCGPGGLAYQELQGSELADVANPSEYFYLRAEGDSMLPDIRPGDLVLVHIQPEVDSGQLAVVTIDGEEGALKKFIQKDNAIILQSFNQAYPPRVFVGEEMTAVHVCGRVVETKRKW